MPPGRFIAAFLLFLFSILLLVFIIPAEIAPTDGYAVSARLMPYLAAGGMCVLSGVESFRQWRAPENESALRLAEVRALLVVTGVLIGGALLFLYVHPLAAGGFAVCALMLDLGERRLLSLILLPGVLMALTYWLLYHVLGSGIA
ncbi:hypothetical protein N4R57_19155 [Rhodobacteraceae bacterium D3-12]|nr:hypothetical protein N4R57_19155 [Rhodobacteraceae bacterium D3-12]